MFCMLRGMLETVLWPKPEEFWGSVLLQMLQSKGMMLFDDGKGVLRVELGFAAAI